MGAGGNDRRNVTALLGLALLAGCGSSIATPNGPAPCPITPEGRRFSEEITNSIEKEVEFATEESDSADVSVGWSLAGTDMTIFAIAHLALPCPGARIDSGETCTSDLAAEPLAPDINACFRLGCESSTVAFADVYATRPPQRSPDDPTTISYSSVPPYPVGEVTYSPSLLTRWRFDTSQPAVLTVSAVLARSPVVTLATGEVVDLTLSGQTTGELTDSNVSVETSFSFSRLSPRGPIEVTTKRNGDGPLTGTITMGSEVLANVSQGVFDWQGSCAN
jgi:hypothetical protein